MPIAYARDFVAPTTVAVLVYVAVVYVDWYDSVRMPCEHNGSYVASSKSCTCPIVWKGPRCQECACDRGHCTDANQCKCDGKFFGTLCSQCQTKRRTNATCAGECLPMWYGPSCSVFCHRNETCSGRGTCLPASGKCKCDAGSFGTHCQERCDPPCVRGTCTSFGCSCPVGYAGADCASACPVGVGNKWCSGIGTCHNGSCTCPSHSAGVACERTCPSPGGQVCSGRGECRNGTCQCKSGWSGSGCTCNRLLQCSGHGDCSGDACTCDADFSRGFWAGPACSRCKRGFHGPTCRSYCEPSTSCRGYGTCTYVPELGVAMCQCRSGVASSSTVQWRDLAVASGSSAVYDVPETAAALRIHFQDNSSSRRIPLTTPGLHTYTWQTYPNGQGQGTSPSPTNTTIQLPVLSTSASPKATIQAAFLHGCDKCATDYFPTFDAVPKQPQYCTRKCTTEQCYGGTCTKLGKCQCVHDRLDVDEHCAVCRKGWFPLLEDRRQSCTTYCNASASWLDDCLESSGKLLRTSWQAQPASPSAAVPSFVYVRGRPFLRPVRLNLDLTSAEPCACLPWTSEHVDGRVPGTSGNGHGCRSLVQNGVKLDGFRVCPVDASKCHASSFVLSYVSRAAMCQRKLLEAPAGSFWCWIDQKIHAVSLAGASPCNFVTSNKLKYGVFPNGEYAAHGTCRNCTDTRCMVEAGQTGVLPTQNATNVRVVQCAPELRQHARLQTSAECSYCSGNGICSASGACKCVAKYRREMRDHRIQDVPAPSLDTSSAVLKSTGFVGPRCAQTCSAGQNQTTVCSGHGTCVEHAGAQYCRCDTQPTQTVFEYREALEWYEACPDDKVRDRTWRLQTLDNVSWPLDPAISDSQRAARAKAAAVCSVESAVSKPSKEHKPKYFGNQCQYECKGSPYLTFRGRVCNGYACEQKLAYVARPADPLKSATYVDRVPCTSVGDRPPECCPGCTESDFAEQRIYCYVDPFDQSRTCAKVGCKCPERLSGDACELECPLDQAVGMNVMPSPCGITHTPNNKCCTNDPFPKCTVHDLRLKCIQQQRLVSHLVCNTAFPEVSDPRYLSNCDCVVIQNGPNRFRCLGQYESKPAEWSAFTAWQTLSNVALPDKCVMPDLPKLANTSDDGGNVLRGYCHCSRGVPDACDITCPCKNNKVGSCPTKGKCMCTQVDQMTPANASLSLNIYDTLRVSLYPNPRQSPKFCDLSCNHTCPSAPGDATGRPCSGVGRCTRTCKCMCLAPPGKVSGFVGNACEFTCPGYNPDVPHDVSKVCGGKGTCVADYTKTLEFPSGRARCRCSGNMFGDSCSMSCPVGVNPSNPGRPESCHGNGQKKQNLDGTCGCTCRDKWDPAKDCSTCLKANYDNTRNCTVCMAGFDLKTDCKYLKRPWNSQQIAIFPYGYCYITSGNQTKCVKLDRTSTGERFTDQIVGNLPSAGGISCTNCQFDQSGVGMRGILPDLAVVNVLHTCDYYKCQPAVFPNDRLAPDLYAISTTNSWVPLIQANKRHLSLLHNTKPIAPMNTQDCREQYQDNWYHWCVTKEGKVRLSRHMFDKSYNMVGNYGYDYWKSSRSNENRLASLDIRLTPYKHIFHNGAVSYHSSGFLRHRQPLPRNYDYFYATDLPTNHKAPLRTGMSGLYTVFHHATLGTIVDLWDPDSVDGRIGYGEQRCDMYKIKTWIWHDTATFHIDPLGYLSSFQILWPMGNWKKCWSTSLYKVMHGSTESTKYRLCGYLANDGNGHAVHDYCFGMGGPGVNEPAQSGYSLSFAFGSSVRWSIPGTSLQFVAMSPMAEIERTWRTVVGLPYNHFQRTPYGSNSGARSGIGIDEQVGGYVDLNAGVTSHRQDNHYMVAGYDRDKGIRAWFVHAEDNFPYVKECLAARAAGNWWCWKDRKERGQACAHDSTPGVNNEKHMVYHDAWYTSRGACTSCYDPKCQTTARSFLNDQIVSLNGQEMPNNVDNIEKCLTARAAGKWWCWADATASGTACAHAPDAALNNERHMVFTGDWYTSRGACTSCYDPKCWAKPHMTSTTLAPKGVTTPVVRGSGNIPSTYCAIHEDGTASCTMFYPTWAQLHGCKFLHFIGKYPRLDNACTQGVVSLETSVVMRKVSADGEFTTQKPYVSICAGIVELRASVSTVHCMYKEIQEYFKEFVRISKTS